MNNFFSENKNEVFLCVLVVMPPSYISAPWHRFSCFYSKAGNNADFYFVKAVQEFKLSCFLNYHLLLMKRILQILIFTA